MTSERHGAACWKNNNKKVVVLGNHVNHWLTMVVNHGFCIIIMRLGIMLTMLTTCSHAYTCVRIHARPGERAGMRAGMRAGAPHELVVNMVNMINKVLIFIRNIWLTTMVNQWFTWLPIL